MTGRPSPTRCAFLSAEAAVGLIRSGQTLAIGGAGGVQEPDLLIEALVARFRREGAPADLTEFHPIRTGELEGRGTSLLGEPGLVRRMIGGSFWPVGVPQLIQRIHDNQLEAYNYSIGMMYAILEATAAGRPGVVTGVGLDTFVDPRHGGGGLNRISTAPLVSELEIRGKRFLFYQALPVDVVFIRGTTADEAGNISMEEEPAMCGALLLAQAARASGGRVIAQVKRKVGLGEILPHAVRVPGNLVDAVVVNPQQTQITNVDFDPTLVGAAGFDRSRVPVLAMDAKKVVLRRALREARRGDVTAIGFGLPGFLPAVALEERVFDLLTFTIEHGVVGGINGYAAQGKTFPVSHDPMAILDAPDQLRLYAGGGIDIAYLGVGEFDPEGNVNVSLFGERIPGAGGFIDMTQGIRRICFCVSLGSTPARKLVDRVQQITFSGRRAIEAGQQIVYITELGVFRLDRDGLVLAERAPGIGLDELERRFGRRLRVADDAVEMPAACFGAAPMNLINEWVGSNA